MNFPVRNENNITIISAPTRLEGNTSMEFRQQVIELINGGVMNLVVDLSETDFMDSEGISSIVARISVLRDHGGDVIIAGVSPFILNIMEITHLDQLIKRYDTVDEALKGFKTRI